MDKNETKRPKVSRRKTTADYEPKVSTMYDDFQDVTSDIRPTVKRAETANNVAIPKNPKKSNAPKQPKAQKDGNVIANFFWKDKAQRSRNIFCILTVLCVVVVLAVGFVSAKLDIIDTNDKKTTSVDEIDYSQADIMDEIYDDGELQPIATVNDAVSYTDFSRKWQTNGAPLRHSKNVINILLLGLDSDDALENGGRSDSMILCSLNKKDKKIYLTSFYRDTWTYMNVGGTETYSKMNAAYMYGRDDGIVKTLENNFKIDIDYYVAVDFSSFTDIINKLGGITVDVQQYESDYIRRTSTHKKFPVGEGVKLNGDQALLFARIRKSDSDSDVSRTRRQRIVISSLIDSVKDASFSQINDVMNSLFGYIRTNLSKMEILSYAMKAVANRWAEYDIETVNEIMNMSDHEIYRTGYVGDSSVVFVSFPKVSEKVQNVIYGNSSVVAQNNQDPFDFMHEVGRDEYGLN